MEFKVYHKLPHLNPGEVERAVRSFVEDSHTEESGASKEGLYQQTLEGIAQTLFFNQDGRQVWMVVHNGEILTYVLTHVSKDVDNQLCYWITQAWVDKRVRGHKIVKIWRDQLRAEAKRLLCKHIIIPSSRNEKAYFRFLGGNFHKYVTLLKEDI